MINSALYREPELLDPLKHRALKVAALADFSIAKSMHGVFVAATEITQAALEFPVLFVHNGERDAAGRAAVSPIALLGLAQGENLFVDGSRWDARYVPAFIRRYPFLTGTLRGGRPPGVMIDRAWSGCSEIEGEALFDAQGRPAAALQRVLAFLERFEAEAQRTRGFCARLVELDLLEEMKADATLPDGAVHSVGGFQVIDEHKLQHLPDAPLLELQRSGMLMLLHLQIASLATLPHLVERKARRAQAANASQGAGHGPQ